MRFFTSLATATVLTIIMYLGIIGIAELLKSPSADNNFDLLGVVIWGLFFSPIVIVVLTVTFYATYKIWSVKKLLFISLVSYWTSLFCYWVSQILILFFQKPYDSGWNAPPNTLIEISLFINRYMNIFTLIFIVLGYLLLRRKPSWLHFNGVLLGIISGYVISYGFVILLRLINNSLTSYFYFDHLELGIVIVGAVAGLIVGNIVGNKSFNNPDSITKN